MGFVHYRGYLLYGPHGSGKTSIVQIICKNVIEEDGIVFVCKDPNDFLEGVRKFRIIEPNRKIICLFEDIESIIKQYGDDIILSFLDGEAKIDHVLNIATTNYPELLDKRVVGRPRRFDRVLKIDYPNKEDIMEYLTNKLGRGKIINSLAKKAEGLSFASLAELVISIKCYNKDANEVINILKDLQINKKTSDKNKDDIGF